MRVGLNSKKLANMITQLRQIRHHVRRNFWFGASEYVPAMREKRREMGARHVRSAGLWGPPGFYRRAAGAGRSRRADTSHSWVRLDPCGKLGFPAMGEELDRGGAARHRLRQPGAWPQRKIP